MSYPNCHYIGHCHVESNIFSTLISMEKRIVQIMLYNKDNTRILTNTEVYSEK